MITVQIDAQHGIATVKPSGALTETDFALVAGVVDPLIEHRGGLRGLIIEAEGFAGWADFAGLVAHLRFVRDHHRHIERIAVITDDAIASHLPSLASHFVAAEIRHFAGDAGDQARQWILEPTGPMP